MAQFSEKRCSRCGEPKPIADFFRNRSKADGHDDYCKPCRREYKSGSDSRFKSPLQIGTPAYQQLIAEAKTDFDEWDVEPRSIQEHLQLIETDRARRMRLEEEDEREQGFIPADRRNPGDVLWDMIANAA